ncbi:MAG: carbohydrate ABC transporter permease [Anaerolineae bacterium]|nr:carbohydrate ABC transporter permease [Anaerolineae bacterium]
MNVQNRQTRSLLGRILFWIATALILVFFLFPIYWILITAFKDRPDITQLPPRFVPWVDFQPTTFNFHEILIEMEVSQFGTATEQSPFLGQLFNSVIISGTATVVAVILGTLAAYAFSRFRIKGEGDLLFFILSTRMLPPVVTVIPLFLMFTELGMRNTFHGITLLYITMGLPFVVWMMKGFFDEVPHEFEEAAMIDGYSRLEAIWRIVIPEVIPPMLATAVFVLITAWNEFVFVQLLNPLGYTTVTPFLYAVVGYGRTEWGRVAATTVVFVSPIVIFTFLVRKYLLRGVTFGAVRR